MRPANQTRRRFLATASLACAAGLLGRPRAARAEPPPETATVRLPMYFRTNCQAAEYIAGDLLRAEGFSDVRFVEPESADDSSAQVARGDIDFDWNFPTVHIASLDAGRPIRVLAGMHSGCLELVARDGIDGIGDLKGKRIGVDPSTAPMVVVLMAGYVGLDPDRDIEWVTGGDATPTELFIDGKVDAFLGSPPEPQELRARGIGHTILNTTLDRPWSQYFCCMLAGAAAFIDENPVATRRVLRAILKAADICAADPGLAARKLVDLKFTDRYDFALQSLNELRYDRWREFDPEDTLRFYALRMREAGLIESNPTRIIARGTDWRFLDELRRELKG